MLKFITKIIDECPKSFNDAEAREKYPAKKEESMNIILIQELNRFNKLISTIRSSLGNIRDAMTGLIVFSFELEETLNFIRINKVPKAWMEYSYPSLKPLPAYMEDLGKRVDFFAKWVAEGKPPVFWISRFFFPQGFLTGIQQNFARKYGIAIDKLIYDYEVLPKDQEVLEPAEDGAYVQGFYLEGAKFDYNTMALGESDPKVGCSLTSDLVRRRTQDVLQTHQERRACSQEEGV